MCVATHREDDEREAGEEEKERGPVFSASGLEVQLRSQRGQHGEQETDGEHTQRSAERGVVDGQCSRLLGGIYKKRRNARIKSKDRQSTLFSPCCGVRTYQHRILRVHRLRTERS